MIVLKQFCCYRTGSNVLKLLIDKYIDGCEVYPNKYGHKHNYFNQEKWDEDSGTPDVGLLISIKHPYSWIISRAKWKPLDDHKFVPSRLTIKDISDDTLKKWCLDYSNKYEHWLNLPFNKIIIQYETLLSDPYEILNIICSRWNLSFKTQIVEVIGKVVNPGGCLMAEDFDFSYYLEHRYLTELNDQQKLIVDKNINWDIIPYFKDQL